MPLPQPAGSASHRTAGNFQVQLFIRTVETKLPAPPDPTNRVSRRRIAGVFAASAAVPIALAALMLLLKSLLRAH